MVLWKQRSAALTLTPAAPTVEDNSPVLVRFYDDDQLQNLLHETRIDNSDLLMERNQISTLLMEWNPDTEDFDISLLIDDSWILNDMEVEE